MSDMNGSMGGPGLDDAAVDALLSGAGPAGDPLTEVLTAIRATGTSATPRPSAELAELLAGGATVTAITRRRRGRIVAGVVIAGGTTFALSGVAAAHDALPGPVQRVVTDIYNSVTPIHIATHPQPHRPRPVSPTDTAVPSGTPSEPGDDHSRGREPGDDHGRDGGPGRHGSDGGSGRPGGEDHGGDDHGGGKGSGGGEDHGGGSGGSGGGGDSGGESGHGGHGDD